MDASLNREEQRIYEKNMKIRQEGNSIAACCKEESESERRRGSGGLNQWDTLRERESVM